MRARLAIGAAVIALTFLSYFQFPGHTYLGSDTQIYVPMLEHIWDPSSLARDLVAPGGEGKRIVVADHALLGMTQDRGQLQLPGQRAMLVGELLNRPRETLIPLRPILCLQKCIGRLAGRDFGQPQQLDQTVLIREKAAFHTPFGLGRKRQNRTDAQLA